jgi:Heparinase II/III-like protein
MKSILCGFASCLMVGFLNAATLVDHIPVKASGIGRPASDRAWWAQWAEKTEAAIALKHAENWLKLPMPAFDPERYLDFTTNGDRTKYQAINSRRWDRLMRLVLGECLEGKRRFVPAIDETVRSLCGDPSWILPAHDHGAEVFKGASPYADLAVAMNGYQMALSLWLLEDRLAPETAKLMRENVYKRLIDPVLRTIDGTASPKVMSGHFWARCNHNWNAVCTAGAVGAILAIEPSREVRAKAVEWAVSNNGKFLSGFGNDGYCSEGVGYWNYGFGHFTLLAEVIRQQTSGVVDPFQLKSVREIAQAPAMLEIADGIYPAFADCGLDSRPDQRLMDWVGWRLSKQAMSGKSPHPLAETALLYQTLAGLVLELETSSVPSGTLPSLPLRSWFPDSGVCVFRPAAKAGMAVAIKGGNNAEHHNHNDVGTTVVVWKGRPVLVDPGAMVYRAETFSKDRYRLPIMGSLAHSVPVAAGFLQAAGAQSTGKVLNTDFKPELDAIRMGLSSAYPGSGLKKLEREWSYRRDTGGSLKIDDRFAFDKPSAFETALVGLGDWYEVSSKDRSARFAIDGGKGALLDVHVEFSGPGKWVVTKINNPGKPSVFRLGLALAEPSTDGHISIEISPLTDDKVSRRKLPVVMAPEMLVDAHKAP